MPTSKLTLVRVDGFWKIIPSVFPRKNGRDLPLCCSRLSFSVSIRILLISYMFRSAILRMSFLLEEIFNVFICEIDDLVFFIFLLSSVLTFFQIPVLIPSLRLFFCSFLFCPLFLELVVLLVVALFLFFLAATLASPFLAKKSKPALFFLWLLLLDLVGLRLLHNRLWTNCLDLLLLRTGKVVYRAQWIDCRLG